MSTANQPALKRSLGLPQLVLFGVTYMTIVTVFTTYGYVSAETDNRLPLAYVITTITMAFTALSYGTMARKFPVAGSAYTYSQQAFGGGIGFLTGWATLLDYLFLPLINFMLLGAYLESVTGVPFWIFTLAAIALVFLLNIFGVTLVSRVNVLIIALGVLLALVFVVLSFNTWLRSSGGPGLFAPFTVGDSGWTGIFAGSAVLALSFLGFDAVSTLAEETKDARRNIPRAILITTLVGGLLFTLVSWAGSLAIQPDWAAMSTSELDTASTLLMESTGGELLMNFFVAVYVAGCIGSGMTGQVGVSRILFAMGRDGLLPKPLARVWKKRGTPVVATTTVTVLTLCGIFLPIAEVINVISFGALTAFTIVNLAVLRTFAFRRDHAVTDFRSALRYLVFPIIGTLATAWLWTSLSLNTLVVGLIWLAAGVVILAIVTRGFTRRTPKMDFSEADPSDNAAAAAGPSTGYIDQVGEDYPFRDAR